MSSEIDIVNLALSRLGDTATVSSIDPPEGSAQAEHAAMFYPIARDSMLEMHDWKFATTRRLLAATTSETWEWGYAYATPSGMLKARAVLAETAASDAETQEYDIQIDADDAQIILTDLEDAALLYTKRITDTTKFPPLFVDALSWLLASHLAGPLLKGDAGKAAAIECLKMFSMIYSQAVNSDASQRKKRPDHTPAWIGGR